MTHQARDPLRGLGGHERSFLTDDSCSIQLLRAAIFKPEPPETGCSSGTIEAALTAIATSPQG
jgi:hypothetical protein